MKDSKKIIQTIKKLANDRTWFHYVHGYRFDSRDHLHDVAR